MRPQHHEYNHTETYLETIADLPWGIFDQESKDLENARKVLDNDHFGLDLVKKRIIEFLAVQGLTNNPKGTILCFVGPPGVGKTSLGKSIAKSLN